MDIALITAGSRGDLDPFLALGLGLRSAGHRVRLASNPEHAARVVSRGLEFFPFRASLGTIAATAEGRAAGDPAVTLPRRLLRVRRVLRRHAQYFRDVIDDCRDACQGADAVVTSTIGYGVPHVAEKLGIPHAWGLIYPLSPTRAFPCPLGPLRLTGLAALLSYRVAARIAWQLLGEAIRDWRRRAGLPPIGLREVLARQWRQPVLYAFSPALVPPPPEWPPHHRVTGHWFLDLDEPWRPEPDLAAFLAAGSPPLLVGLGSLTARDPGRLAALVRDALARTGRRAVVLAPYGPQDGLWPSATVYRLDSAPHHRLMPLTAGAIHHGGPGTAAAALRAGLPAFCVPGAIDQRFWAWRLAAAGAAVAPIRADRLTPANLVRAIDGLADERLRRRAQELGAALRREDGVAAAVETLERCWARGALGTTAAAAPGGRASAPPAAPSGEGRENESESETSTAYMGRVRGYYSRELRSYLDHVGTTWQGALARTFDGTIEPRASNLWLADRAGIQPGDRLLDAGCGVCGPSMDIAEAFPEVHVEALTLGADQADAARRLIAARGLAGRIRLQVGDFHQLPYADGSFDRVLFLESSGYSYDRGLLAREALRVLRPGGVLYVKGVFLADGPLVPEMTAQFDLFDEIYAHRTLPMADLEGAVAAAGFTGIASSELNASLSSDLFFAAMFESDGSGGQRLTAFGRSHHRDVLSLRPIYGEIKAQKPADTRPPGPRGRSAGRRGRAHGESPAPGTPSYELLLDDDEKGLWEHEVFCALADHLASRLELRRTHAKEFQAHRLRLCPERIELHHHLAILRRTPGGAYWVLDSHDWITPFTGHLRAFALDPCCQVVLKCQYARRPYAWWPLTKIRPWTYFETHCSPFQLLLPELRATPKVREPLLFRGNLSWASRAAILEGLAGQGLVNLDFTRSLPYQDYARELAAQRMALALPGMGKLCHREIEAFGVGTPVLMPTLRAELHEPLIPDHHYVAVDADVETEPPEAVVRHLAERYRQVAADPGYLAFVAANAMAWYDRNVRMPASLDLTLRLLQLAPAPQGPQGPQELAAGRPALLSFLSKAR